MPVHAPTLCTTTLPSSAAHARVCTRPVYHHPPIVCHPHPCMHPPCIPPPSRRLPPMPMCAPALCITTLPSSAAHTHACTHPAYHHPPITHAHACTCPVYHHPPVCRPVCAPALRTTPPIICPHTRACTLAPCTTTLPLSAAHACACTHPAYHHPPIVYPHACACTRPAYHPSRLPPHACTPALLSSATHA
ncbi:hypothetical protein ID866_11960, partial [Astraeus odoratus]